ncbi:DUF547 domain-containing protein [Marinobacter sp. SS13-12]|uniref:DUF547 domain-containing protein n=1 Tax=Marinobacter sp. SS13-12 TaxID=3050451 RepID=UPI002556F01F|nr:DUF547 domain-containing protein [Marinobacter sp. SS13-12]MDK8462357.1 DUF547 domain-containing protein [Marinobacter sp. SS13-12]
MRFVQLSATFSMLLVLFAGVAQAEVNREIYRPYQQMLEQFLAEKELPGDGLVTAFDYQAAVDHDETVRMLSEQRGALAGFDLASLEGRDESVAFWINAYNFFMLDQILTERPDGKLVGSVWDYGGRVNPFVDSVFDRDKFRIDGQDYSLNQIEKEILLGNDYADKGWKDARVHFAVNCASVGCPPLREVIYTADNLEALLAENTRRAFATDRHLRIEEGTLHVTELFKWYEKDFVEAAGSRKAYIEEWADSSVAGRVADTSDIEFIDYDWALNTPANFPEFR